MRGLIRACLLGPAVAAMMFAFFSLFLLLEPTL